MEVERIPTKSVSIKNKMILHRLRRNNHISFFPLAIVETLPEIPVVLWKKSSFWLNLPGFTYFRQHHDKYFLVCVLKALVKIRIKQLAVILEIWRGYDHYGQQ